jgi:hypothetical protein
VRLNPLSLVQGATEREVDALFGASSAEAAHRQQDFCVRYQFLPQLSYTLLFRHRVAESIWLTEGDFVPYLCDGILVRTIRVLPKPWYPSQAPRNGRSSGCYVGDAAPCEVP